MSKSALPLNLELSGVASRRGFGDRWAPDTFFLRRLFVRYLPRYVQSLVR